MKHLPLVLGGAVAFLSLLSPTIANGDALVGTGLTVSPITQNVSAQPGETVAATIKVSNPTNQAVTAYPLSLDFRSDGITGKPLFYKATSGTSRFTLSDWFKQDQNRLVIPAQQSIEFGYHLHVPTNAEAGDHYAGALFSDNASAANLNSVLKIDVRSMVGTLIFLRVAGDIQESAQLISFLANKSFSFTPQISLNYQIRDAGNVHLQPYGEVNVKNWRGQSVDTQKVNASQASILPDSSRVFNTEWKGNRFSFGRYTAELAAFYGTTNQSLGAELSFWIIPLWAILFIIAFILFTILVVRFRPHIQLKMSSPKSSRRR